MHFAVRCDGLDSPAPHPYLRGRMAKLTKQLAIYDPVSRAERARMVTIEGSGIAARLLGPRDVVLRPPDARGGRRRRPVVGDHLPGQVRPHQALALMPRWTDTVIIDGQPVEVVIYTTGGVSVLNLQELVERAWRDVSKQVTVNGVAVKVRELRQ
jgi:hypothetical protein